MPAWIRNAEKREQARRTGRLQVRAAKREAKKRGLAWELDRDFARHLLFCRCYYCGASPPDPDEGYLNGIDRVNNNRGYVRGNIVPCCWICNQMKSNRSKTFFIAQCRRIVNYAKDRKLNKVRPCGGQGEEPCQRSLELRCADSSGTVWTTEEENKKAAQKRRRGRSPQEV